MEGAVIVMDLEVLSVPDGEKGKLWRGLLARVGLEADEAVEETALLWEGGALVAAASRQGEVLKCIAVSPDRQGEGLLPSVLTPLRQGAFQSGIRRLFLYTKPENEALFTPLLFYSVARTDRVLLMEDRRSGIRRFLEGLPAEPAAPGGGAVGAAVMNCDPFTAGHRHLISAAAAECRQVYVFVLSEDRGHFSAADRFELVRRGTADISNVMVLPTGPYLISRATFPTYFLKNREQAEEAQCQLDIEIFLRYFVPHFAITRRYVGTEPLSPLTDRYNAALLSALPGRGVEVRLVPRLERRGVPVSASAVRAALAEGDWAAVRALVPRTTFDYLRGRDFAPQQPAAGDFGRSPGAGKIKNGGEMT